MQPRPPEALDTRARDGDASGIRAVPDFNSRQTLEGFSLGRHKRKALNSGGRSDPCIMNGAVGSQAMTHTVRLLDNPSPLLRNATVDRQDGEPADTAPNVVQLLRSIVQAESGLPHVPHRDERYAYLFAVHRPHRGRVALHCISKPT